MRATVTLDSDGPQTRDEVFDSFKAFKILTDRDCKSMSVPLATYMAWTKWSADEKGIKEKDADTDRDPFPVGRIPEKVFGDVRISVAAKFTMY